MKFNHRNVLAAFCAGMIVLSSTDFSVMKASAGTQPASYYSLPNSKVLKKDVTSDTDLLSITDASPLSFSAASNERESAQLVMQCSSDLTDITIATSDMKNASGDIIPANAVSVFFENYVYEDGRFGWNLTNEKGYYPDALIGYELAVKTGKNKLLSANGINQGIWFTLNVPAQTAAGEYSTYFNIAYKKDGTTYNNSIPVLIKVFDFSMPEKTANQSYFHDFYNSDTEVYNGLAQMDSSYEYRKAVSDFLDERKLSSGYPQTGNWDVNSINTYVNKLYEYVRDSKCPYYNLDPHYISIPAKISIEDSYFNIVNDYLISGQQAVDQKAAQIITLYKERTGCSTLTPSEETIIKKAVNNSYNDMKKVTVLTQEELTKKLPDRGDLYKEITKLSAREILSIPEQKTLTSEEQQKVNETQRTISNIAQNFYSSVRFSRYDHDEVSGNKTYHVLGLETELRRIVDKSIESETDLLQYAYLYCGQTDEPQPYDYSRNLEVLVNDKIFSDTKNAVNEYIQEKYSDRQLGKKLQKSLQNIIYLPTTTPSSEKVWTIKENNTQKNVPAYISILYNGLGYLNLDPVSETFCDVYTDGYYEGAQKSSYTVNVETDYKVNNYCALFNDFSNITGTGFDAKDFDTTINAIGDTKMWWYSCMSHASAALAGHMLTANKGTTNGSDSVSENSLSVARVNKWQQYKLGIRGELYWAVDEYKKDGTFNNNMWDVSGGHCGNEGMLIYPNAVLMKNNGISQTEIKNFCEQHGYFSSSIRLENISEGCDDYDYLNLAGHLIGSLKEAKINVTPFKNRLNSIYASMFDDCNYNDGKATSRNLNTARNDLAAMITEMTHLAEGTINEVTQDYNRTLSIESINNWKTSNKVLCIKIKPNIAKVNNAGNIQFCIQSENGEQLSSNVTLNMTDHTAKRGTLTSCDDGWYEYIVAFQDIWTYNNSTGNSTASRICFNSISNPFLYKDMRIASNVVPKPDNPFYDIYLDTPVKNWKSGGALISFNYKATNTCTSSNSNDVTIYLIQKNPWERVTGYSNFNVSLGTSSIGTVTDLGGGWYNYKIPVSSFAPYSDSSGTKQADIVEFRWINRSFLIEDFKVVKEVTASESYTFDMAANNVTGVANWHSSGKALSFDYFATNTINSGNTAQLSLMDNKWKRLNKMISLNLTANTVSCGSSKVGTVTKKANGWYNVIVPLNSTVLNTSPGETATGDETFSMIHFKKAYITKSFAIDNIKIINEVSDKTNQTHVSDGIYIENWHNSDKGLTFEFLPSRGNTDLSLEFTLTTKDWARLTKIIKVNTGTMTANYGSIKKLSDGWYRYSIDLCSLAMNDSSGEAAKGNETAELLYFRTFSKPFVYRNLGEYIVTKS
ncbi:MAG: DUF4091 domain-containing protein [Oscillospiraceae bacterium]|nr:DUF4091 domain-containing protein [Oscillospiraceae bacterium]